MGTPKGNVNQGRKENWPPECPVDSVRDRVKGVRTLVDEIAASVSEVVVRRLAWELAQFTLREAEARRRRGELEFHDLLVLARAVLRDPEHGWEVRRRLRARYTRLLLDEFQDTDPIQCDLAALLASGDPDARDHRWDELEVDPGRLFVVGDPKQSIYRFRRADIAAFLRARAAFGASPRRLTRNFRTARPVIDFVNAVFRELIVAEPESQPEYVALEAVREAAPVGAPVVLLGATPELEKPSADELRRREADDVAAVVGRALREGWQVSRPRRRRQRAVRALCAWATSASSSRPGPRSASSRTRSRPPASRTAPRRRRSSTAPARSATCSSCCRPSTTPPTSSRW